MPKIKAKELTDAAVSHISLVDRGANREPFRIIKREGEGQMLDFSKGLIGLLKAEAAPAAIVAVAFSKQFDPSAAAEILSKAGLEHGDAVETDAALTFPINGATDEQIEQSQLFKINDDVAFGATGIPEKLVKDYVGYDFESTDFKTVFGTNKAPSMIACAMGALQDTIYNCLSNADKVETAKGDIEAALNDFSGVVMGIVDLVPQTAFKLEAAVAEVGTVKKTEDAGGKTGTKKEEPAPTGQKTEEEQRKETAEPTEAEKAGEGAKIDPPKSDEDKDKVEKLDPELVAKANSGDVQALAKLTAQAAKLTASLAGAADDGNGAGSGEGSGEGAGLEVKKGEGEDGKKAPAADLSGLGDVIADAVKKALEPVQADLKTVTEDVNGLRGNLKKFDDALKLDIIGGDTGGEKGQVQKGDNDEGGEDEGDEGFLVIDTGYDDPFPERRSGGRRQQASA